MDRCPKDEATAKNFVWYKNSSHSQENWKNLLGGMPPPFPPSEGYTYDMYRALGNTLLNLLVSAAENCELMIHTLSRTTSISGSAQYPLRMNLILNFELGNGIG